jgi:hypothetical protein
MKTTKRFILAAILFIVSMFIFFACGQHSIFGDDASCSPFGNYGCEELSSSSSVVANNNNSSSSNNSPSSSSLDSLAAKMAEIRTRYTSIQTNFPGGYFITAPSITSPYAAGKVKSEVLQAGLDAVNLVRFIAGVPDDVELDDEYIDLCQHGAVLLNANNVLTHYPAKPANMPQNFFNKGYEATTNANIATVQLPSRSVYLYMEDDDASNYTVVGHRRWILHPFMKKTGFGVGATEMGVMYSTDGWSWSSSSTVDYEYIAWPSPGAFPLTFINNNTPWSITVNAQKYGTPNYNNVVVTLKDLTRGTVWTFSENTVNQPNTLRTMYFNVNTQGTGIANAIIFRPNLSSSFQYSDGDELEVTVTGLNMPLNYTVKLFSM